ncbi:CG14965 [Drosophila busckii]|uniref:CG14965 n=1 Tax=Drosophila busckii TaxID=30019 RepID=A0A0M3QVS9_DROBS|nr:CG14965 [Drosophila busckii]
MGGTRCIFRDCNVSSQRNPKMHFFKLPVRDPKRLQAWVKNAGCETITNLDHKKLSNRSVCARHFRYECFMNYKLDRLVANQTPTLWRIDKDLAWDMEQIDENGEALMVRIEAPTQKHLIPPDDFECPLGFDEAIGKKSMQLPISMEVTKKKQSEPAPFEAVQQDINMSITDINMSESENSKTKELVYDLGPELRIELINDEINNTNMNIEENNFEDMQYVSLDEYRTLQQECNSAKAENMSLKQQFEALRVETQNKVANPPQVGKDQLYKGIKKYLGPTMAALVRMEMFASADRTWLEDERDFSKELLQLGEHVYTHCCEEWRLRLPSLHLTRSWLQDVNTIEVDSQNL